MAPHLSQEGTRDKEKRSSPDHSTHGLGDNLLLILIKGFADALNETSVTACLPLPKSVDDPLPMGVLPVDITGSLLRLWSKSDTLHVVNPYSLNQKRVAVQFSTPFNFSTISKTKCTYYGDNNVTFPCSQII